MGRGESGREKKYNGRCVIGEVQQEGLSGLRRGIGLKRSSREKVRAAEPCEG